MKETLEADYARKLLFQRHQAGESTEQQSSESKVFFTSMIDFSVIPTLPFPFSQTEQPLDTKASDDYKVAAQIKSRSDRQNLSGSTFTNIQFVYTKTHGDFLQK